MADDLNQSAGYLEIDELYDNFRKMSTAVIDRERDLQDRNEELAAAEEELRHQVEEYLRTHAALVEEKTKLESILACMSEGLSIQDLDYRVILQNEAHKKMVGEAIGKYCYNAYQHNDTVCNSCPMQKAFADGGSHLKLTQVRDGEKEHFFEIIASPLRNPQGKMIGGIEVVRDVSDRMRADQEIRRLNQELEERVIERTAELELANHELESFSYSVSHDLRAPLRHLNGYTSLLLEEYRDRLDANGKTFLERIGAAVRKMDDLVGDMLQLAQVSRQGLTRGSVDLGAMSLEILEELQQTQPGRVVICRIAPGVEATGDPHLLRLAMENLLANAWKYTGKTDGAVIEFGVTEQEGEKVYFVRDNGVGFDMAYVGNLFGPFQRLHPAQEFEGTGIGLATVQRIIQRHGGRIWAEAEVDRGATFFFTLQEAP
jgi:signal transduction histidine kinase